MLVKIRHPLVSNSFYLYIAHLFDYLFLILMFPFIARKLGPVELGNVALAQTVGLFILIFMEFGFSLAATREVAKNRNNKIHLNNFIGKAFTFKLTLIPIITVLSIFSISFFPIFKLRPHYIFIVLIGAIFQGLSPNWFFQGIEKLKLVALSKTIFRGIGFIFILLFTNNEEDGWIVLLVYTFTSIFIFIYLFKNLLKISGKIYFFKNYDLKSFWLQCRWLFLISIIPIIYQNFSAFMLSGLIEPIKLGFYFGASKIYLALNSLYGPIGQAFYPRLIAAKKNNFRKSEKLAFKLFWILLCFGIVFCSLLFFFPQVFIIILLGEKYLGASATLQLFGIVLPLTAISHVLGRQWMIIKENEKEFSSIILFSFLISILFFVFSVDFLSIKVVPISLIIYEISVICMILLRKK
ncbi:MAG: oligosaccharide flippase family protein [Dehalococcoidia bacterium]